MDEQLVKIDCHIIDCKYNLWIEKKIRNCNLKNIQIGTKIITGFEHGVGGACLNMRIRGERDGQ